MVRRIVGTICLASSLMMILWLATGATASGFVKFLLLGIVGSILVLYKFDEIAARMPNNRRTTLPVQTSPDGVFGTELPPEAFAEPIPEVKPVNLSQSGSGIFKSNDSSDGTLLSLEADPEAELEAHHDVEADTKIETEVEPAHSSVAATELAATNGNGSTEVVQASEPVFIQLADYSDDELVQSVRAGEASLVSVLAESGMLSTEGPLTDSDVATMVFVAVSSDDLLRALIDGKEAEAQAAALSYSADAPQLYQPAPQLVDQRS